MLHDLNLVQGIIQENQCEERNYNRNSSKNVSHELYTLCTTNFLAECYFVFIITGLTAT